MRLDGFDWDKGNWPKCAKHGLSKDEIEFALMNGPLVMADRSPQTSETRFNAIGRTQAGKHVFIVFSLHEKASVELLRPISARYMHRKEIDHYEQQDR